MGFTMLNNVHSRYSGTCVVLKKKSNTTHAFELYV